MSGNGFRISVYPSYVPAFLLPVHYALPRFAQVLDKSTQGLPAGGVHVDVILFLDVILVHHVGEDAFCGMGSLEQVHEPLFKVFAVVCQKSGLVTYSILFCELFVINDYYCKKSVFLVF